MKKYIAPPHKLKGIIKRKIVINIPRIGKENASIAKEMIGNK